MKNFFVGFLVAISLSLFYQNLHLKQELRKQISKSQEIKKDNVVKFKKKKIQKKVPIETQEQEETIAYNDGKDPRCPDTRPYYNKDWGCLVIKR